MKQVPSEMTWLIAEVGMLLAKIEDLIEKATLNLVDNSSNPYPDLGRRVVNYLGSKRGSSVLLNHARHYFGGMWKLEPGDAEEMRLPPSLVR